MATLFLMTVDNVKKAPSIAAWLYGGVYCVITHKCPAIIAFSIHAEILLYGAQRMLYADWRYGTNVFTHHVIWSKECRLTCRFEKYYTRTLRTRHYTKEPSVFPEHGETLYGSPSHLSMHFKKHFQPAYIQCGAHIRFQTRKIADLEAWRLYLRHLQKSRIYSCCRPHWKLWQ